MTPGEEIEAIYKRLKARERGGECVLGREGGWAVNLGAAGLAHLEKAGPLTVGEIKRRAA